MPALLCQILHFQTVLMNSFYFIICFCRQVQSNSFLTTTEYEAACGGCDCNKNKYLISSEWIELLGLFSAMMYYTPFSFTHFKIHMLRRCQPEENSLFWWKLYLHIPSRTEKPRQKSRFMKEQRFGAVLVRGLWLQALRFIQTKRAP